MKRIWLVMIFMGITMGLAGCGGRELEDREYPTVLVMKSEDVQGELEKRQAGAARYQEYGMVKAVVLENQLAEQEDKVRKIMLYLEDCPSFSRNLFLFRAPEEELKKIEQNQAQEGLYLEDYYKNQPVKTKQKAVTLQIYLNAIHNGESLPVIKDLPLV